MKTVRLPTAYTEGDRRRIDAINAELDAIGEEFRARIKPYMQALIEIEQNYAPRYIIQPDDPA